MFALTHQLRSVHFIIRRGISNHWYSLLSHFCRTIYLFASDGSACSAANIPKHALVPAAHRCPSTCRRQHRRFEQYGHVSARYRVRSVECACATRGTHAARDVRVCVAFFLQCCIRDWLVECTADFCGASRVRDNKDLGTRIERRLHWGSRPEGRKSAGSPRLCRRLLLGTQLRGELGASFWGSARGANAFCSVPPSGKLFDSSSVVRAA